MHLNMVSPMQLARLIGQDMKALCSEECLMVQGYSGGEGQCPVT